MNYWIIKVEINHDEQVQLDVSTLAQSLKAGEFKLQVQQPACARQLLFGQGGGFRHTLESPPGESPPGESPPEEPPELEEPPEPEELPPAETGWFVGTLKKSRPRVERLGPLAKRFIDAEFVPAAEPVPTVVVPDPIVPEDPLLSLPEFLSVGLPELPPVVLPELCPAELPDPIVPEDPLPAFLSVGFLDTPPVVLP